jgi:MEMO1 family protein
LSTPGTVVIASSDFCHWGTRFRYTYYEEKGAATAEVKGTHLKAGSRVPRDRPIHESIAAVDARCMHAVESGSHAAFRDVLDITGNTVCGRHPIGVVMAAFEALGNEEGPKGRFRFVRYERSGLVESVRDSSVSYCSAYAVF